LKRIIFCTSALERVKTSTPVLNDALNLLSRELAAVGVDLKSVTNPGRKRARDLSTDDVHGVMEEHSSYMPDDGQTISPGLEDFDFSDIHIDPSIFDAFSELEPISVNVGALDTYQ
jgi:hypothetical protein